MRVGALIHTVKAWLNLCGQSCCVARSQAALTKTLERDQKTAP